MDVKGCEGLFGATAVKAKRRRDSCQFRVEPVSELGDSLL